MRDDFIIFLILTTNCLVQRLQKMGLITEYQSQMITKWLTTGTKKAERRFE